MDKEGVRKLERELVVALYKNSYKAFELEDCRAIAHRYADWFYDRKFIEMGPNELSIKLIIMMLQNMDKRRYRAYKPIKIIGFYREDVENQTPRGIAIEEICKEAAFEFFFEMLEDGQITVAEVADLMELPVEEVEQEYKEYQSEDNL